MSELPRDWAEWSWHGTIDQWFMAARARKLVDDGLWAPYWRSPHFSGMDPPKDVNQGMVDFIYDLHEWQLQAVGGMGKLIKPMHKDPDWFLDRVKGWVKEDGSSKGRGAIILLHQGSESDLEAVPAIAEYWKKRHGYSLCRLSEVEAGAQGTE